jgi:hypothetical protein
MRISISTAAAPAKLEPPSLEDWPKLTYAPANARRVDLATVTREEVLTWKTGEVLLLNGKMLTGRDAAHKRMTDMLSAGQKLPVDFTNRFIYYVGPVDPVRDEVVGPAGPTTATRMDKFTRQMLEQTGLLGMIGKSERGQIAIDAIKDNRGGVPDGGRRRGLSGVQGHQGRQGSRLRGSRHGGDLRVRCQGYAGDGGGRFQGLQRP